LKAAATRLALLAAPGAVILVLLVYAPALSAPFLVPKFAALEITAALGWLALAARRTTAPAPRWARPIVVGGALVFATSALSWGVGRAGSVGAPYAGAAIARLGALFGVAAGVSVLDGSERPRRRLLATVAVAAATVAAVGLLQHVGFSRLSIPVLSVPGSTFGNRNLAAEVMAMALPLGGAVAVGAEAREERAAGLLAISLELAYLGVTRARGAWLAAAVGLVTVLWLLRHRWSPRLVAIGVVGVSLAAIAAAVPPRFDPRDEGDSKRYAPIVAFVEASVDPDSPALRTRTGLWRRTLEIIRDHPWTGVGPGNWPVVFPRYAEPGAATDRVLSATLAPRQAHNDLLERTAETGVPGGAALLALVAGVIVQCRRRLCTDLGRTRVETAAAAGSMTAMVTLSMASFPLEMPATITLTGIALGLIAVDGRDVDARPHGMRAMAVVLVAAVCVVGAAVRGERSVRASLRLGDAERAIRPDHGFAGDAAAIDALRRSLDANPASFDANHREAELLLRVKRPAESKVAAQRALSIEPESPNAWASLAAAELAMGESAASIRAASEALDRLNDYPFALSVRARAEDAAADAPGAERDRERLTRLATDAPDEATRRAARSFALQEEARPP